jgi:hypothetical protein
VVLKRLLPAAHLRVAVRAEVVVEAAAEAAVEFLHG